MRLQTASQVVNFAAEIEEKLAKFYEQLAKKNPEQREFFLSLAKEGRKYKLWIQRAYHEVVTDALETGFSFEGLDTDEGLIEENLSENRNLPDILDRALDTEKRIQNFYQSAAQKSKSFLADVPRTFERVARRREKRREKLKSIS